MNLMKNLQEKQKALNPQILLGINNKNFQILMILMKSLSEAQNNLSKKPGMKKMKINQ